MSYIMVQREDGNMGESAGEGDKKDAAESREENGRSQRSRMPERSDKAPGRIYDLHRTPNKACMLVVFHYRLVLVIGTLDDIYSRHRRGAHRSRNRW
jgi:hypothetical protein